MSELSTGQEAMKEAAQVLRELADFLSRVHGHSEPMPQLLTLSKELTRLAFECEATYRLDPPPDGESALH